MASSKEFVSFVIDQLRDLDEIACRSMMGEYIVYYRGKIAAYICDNRLLVKPVDAAKALMPDAPHEPPYKGAKDMLLVENIDDSRFLAELFLAMYPELPDPKPKKNKPK
ncbi:MAG: TfoX/Sxy family protein [Bacteroides sp.]|nr:TfoX/Sxy family protein [Prevotella sp.]MCM1407479.1 TfoX/Sxy family protein [Treponema brennaborense]MCM1469969.1 TfoX/Sxy family protein [Bacteroides sp.]